MLIFTFISWNKTYCPLNHTVTCYLFIYFLREIGNCALDVCESHHIAKSKLSPCTCSFKIEPADDTKVHGITVEHKIMSN